MYKIFFDPVNGINFLISALFCLIYLLVNMLIFHLIFGEGMRVANRMSNIYGLALSLPVMPFLTNSAILAPFSATTIAIFALSYVIWQTIYVTSQHNISAPHVIVSLSWANFAAWVVVGLVNFFLYAKLAQTFANLYN